jgi:RNA polymerase sigma-70 factor (ECF subfamily)
MTWDLQKLFVRHAREIDRFLRRRGHNAETAADITQDTFLRVLASPPGKALTDHNPKAYLYQVSRNLSVNHLRRENLIQTVDLDEASAVADPAPSAEKIVYSRQCLAQTRKALAELPDRTRMAFEMHRLGDKTIQEVAETLGLSTSRTWGLIHDAYRHLLTRVDDL